MSNHLLARSLFSARRNAPAMLAVLVLITGTIYWPAFASKDFFGDDFMYVVSNPSLQRATFWQILTERVNAFEFLPLRDLTYWIDWRLFGSSPLAFRLHNWVWYLASCVAAWFAAYQLAELHTKDNPRNSFIALAVLAIFALHPLHVEPVAWIASRKDLISGSFVLAATALWSRGLAVQRMTLCWAAIPCILLAVAGKTVAIVFPVVAIALWWQWNRQWTRQWLALLGALVALVAGALILEMLTRGKTGFVVMPALSEWNPLALVARIGGMALSKTMLPVDLRLVYDELFPAITPGFGIYSALGILLYFVTGGALWVYWRRKALWAFGVAWFCVFLVPYLQIIPTRTWSLFSDCFAFLSIFGAAISIAVALSCIPRPAWRSASLVGLSAILAGLSFARSYDWRSAEMLLINDSRRAHGVMSVQEDVIDTIYLPSQRYDDAVAAANRIAHPMERRLLELRIESRRLQQQGTKQEWLAFADRTLKTERGLVTGNIRIGSMFGIAFLESGLPVQAEAIYSDLVQSRSVSPGERADARYNLALSIERQGRYGDAIAAYRQVVDDTMTPRHVRVSALNNIGAQMNRLGNPTGAEHAFSAALRIDPVYEFAAVNLARLYAAQARTRDLDQLLAGPAGELPEIRRRFQRQ